MQPQQQQQQQQQQHNNRLQNSRHENKDNDNTTNNNTRSLTTRHAALPLTQFFSEEGRVVLGRILASAIFYGATLKVAVYQYGNLRSGLFDVQDKVRMITLVAQRLVGTLAGQFAFRRKKPDGTAAIDVQDESAEEDDEIKTEQVEKGLEEEEEEYTSLDDAVDEDDGPDEDDLGSEDGAAHSEDENNDSDHSKDGDSPDNEGFRPFFFLDSVIA